MGVPFIRSQRTAQYSWEQRPPVAGGASTGGTGVAGAGVPEINSHCSVSGGFRRLSNRPRRSLHSDVDQCPHHKRLLGLGANWSVDLGRIRTSGIDALLSQLQADYRAHSKVGSNWPATVALSRGEPRCPTIAASDDPADEVQGLSASPDHRVTAAGIGRCKASSSDDATREYCGIQDSPAHPSLRDSQRTVNVAALWPSTSTRNVH